MRGGLRLFCGCEFVVVAQHVDAGDAERTVGTHGFPDDGGLAAQRGFFHHVPGQGDAVFAAPTPDCVCKGGGKQLRDEIVKTIAWNRNPALRQIPDQLRQRCEDIFAEGRYSSGTRSVHGRRTQVLRGAMLFFKVVLLVNCGSSVKMAGTVFPKASPTASL